MQDMHYADFAEDDVSGPNSIVSDMVLIWEDQSTALLAAIKEYEASKWKVIGQKVGKPAKVGTPTRILGRDVDTQFTRLANNMRRKTSVEGFEELGPQFIFGRNSMRRYPVTQTPILRPSLGIMRICNERPMELILALRP